MKQGIPKKKPGGNSKPKGEPPGPIVGEMTQEQLQQQVDANMSEADVNAYMMKLLGDRNPQLVGLEAHALSNFKRITADMAQQQNRLTRITQEAEQLRNALQRSEGQRDAYAQVLVLAEQERRVKAVADAQNKEEGDGKAN